MTAQKILSLAIVLCAASLAGAETKMLLDFEQAGAAKVRTNEASPGLLKASVEESPSGGHFLTLQFTRAPKGGYAYALLPVTDALSKSAADYDGVTFKVKGDGGAAFGCIEIRTDDYTNIFQAVFSLASTEWKEVGIRWDEFFQMNDNVAEAAIDWSKLNNFGFGSRAGWGSSSFSVDDLALAKLPPRARPQTPEGAARLAATIAKLARAESVKIVALGDSITFGTKIAEEDRPTALYFQVAARGLEEKFKGAKVAVVNAGVGGETVAEGIVRTGHEVAAESPDLVIVLLGANDAFYDFPDSRVRATMNVLIDKLLETTNAEILLLGPTPISDKPGVPERYDKLYADIAAERGIAYLDLTKVFRALPTEDFQAAYADNVHWSQAGHRAAGTAVSDFISALYK